MRRPEKFYYNNMDGICFGAVKFPVSKMALMKGFAAGKTMLEIANQFFMLSPFFSASTPPSLKEFITRKSSSPVAA